MPKPKPKPQEKPMPKKPKGKPKPKLTPYVFLLGVLLVGSQGCETTKYRYLPTAPDTVVVRDTVVVEEPCEDKGPGWGRRT